MSHYEHDTDGKVLHMEDHREVWEGGKVNCLLCDFVFITTIHKDATKTKLECPNCGGFSSKYTRSF